MSLTPPAPERPVNSAPPVPVLSDKGRAFRYSWRRFLVPFVLFCTTLYPVIAVTVGCLLFLLRAGRMTPLYWASLGTAALGAAALGIAYSLVTGTLLILVLPTRVNADGIRGQNFWGASVYLPWYDMRLVGKRRILGFPYLVLTGAGRGTIWLSLLLDDLPGLRDLAGEYGGSDHVLAEALTAEAAPTGQRPGGRFRRADVPTGQ
jgi:hypothetical protein